MNYNYIIVAIWILFIWYLVKAHRKELNRGLTRYIEQERTRVCDI